MFNIPNLVTLARLALVVIMTIAVMFPSFQPWSNVVALVTFFIAACTDWLDGYLARKLNLVTNLGKLLDPLADKIAISAAFIYIASAGVCPAWVVIVIIGREFLVTGVRQVAQEQNQIIPADVLGKVKMVFQIIYCVYALIVITLAGFGDNVPWWIHQFMYFIDYIYFGQIALWSALFLTVYSGAMYCWVARRFFSLVLMCFIGVVFGLSSSSMGQEMPVQAPSPNVIFILVDDLGWGDVGVLHQNARKKAGLPAISTPKLDTMAGQGIQLLRHYCGAPVCAPSRASLFTGVHQGNARVVRNNTFDMPIENSHTIGTVLKQAGYSTAIIGKWGIAGGRESAGNPDASTAFPTKRGFDYFFGYIDHISGHNHYPKGEGLKKAKNDLWDMNRVITEEADMCYSTDLFTARAKKWIADGVKADPKKPFFVALMLTAPHAVLSVPRMAYPTGGGLKGGVQWTGKPHALINTAEGDAPADAYIYPEYAKTSWTMNEKRHATMVTRIDDAVGDIMALLRDLKIDKNTIVVFSSDNGPHNEGGQDPRFFESFAKMDGVKRDTWEAGCRVPTFVYWPAGIKAGSRSMVPAQFHDWLATFAELAGVPVPARTDGVSLVPVLTGRGERKNGVVYIEYFFPGKTPDYKQFDASHANAPRDQEQVIYVGRFKGIRTGIKSAQDEFRIYDTEKDPKELNNLALQGGAFDKVQQQMKARALQVRRVYDYENVARGNAGKRPYDAALVSSLGLMQTNPPKTEQMQMQITHQRALPWTPQVVRDYKAWGKNEIPSDGFKFPADSPQEFTSEWTGWISVPADGEYTFELVMDGNKDSKAFVRLHDMPLIDAEAHIFNQDATDTESRVYDASTTVNCTEMKQDSSIKTTAVPLQAGKHPIRISYVHGAGPASPMLKLSFKVK